jgi:hypothetical protein
MCLGGGSSDDSKMVKLQETEAQEARDKETQRQGRIDQGLAQIKALFEGSPVMGTRSAYRAPTTTYEDVVTPDRQVSGGYKSVGQQGRQVKQTKTIKGGTSRVAKTDPGGYYDETYDTGQRSGGFDTSFFDKFKQAILDYYMPQVEEQYGDAKSELMFRLARAGTLDSTMANSEFANLTKQNELQQGKVRSQADTGVTDLKDRIASERAAAENQLYATENPEVAANQATASVRNITAAQPDLSPLADIFKIAAVGGANYLKGVTNQSLQTQYPATASNTGGRNQKVIGVA